MGEPNRPPKSEDEEQRPEVAEEEVLDHVRGEASGEWGDVGAEDEDGSQD
jgi:hypothetical protein